MKPNYNSFRSVKDQATFFDSFQQSFLLRVQENSPDPSCLILSQNNLNEKQSGFENIPSKKDSKSRNDFCSEEYDKPFSPKKSSNLNIENNENNIDLESANDKKQKQQLATQRSRAFDPKTNPKLSTNDNEFADCLYFFQKEQNPKLFELHFQNENSLVMPFVKKFIAKLKNASYFRDISQIKSESLHLLNDKIHFHRTHYDEMIKTEPIVGKQYFSQITELIQSKLYRLKAFFTKNFFLLKTKKFLKGHQFVIHPYHNFRIFWDIMHLVIIIFWFFYIPLLLAFSEVGIINTRVNRVTVFLLIFDFFLNFNTCYFKNGVVEKKRLNIILNYFYGSFLIDLVTFLPLCFELLFERTHDVTIKNNFLSLLKLVFFFKVTTLKEITLKIFEKFLIKENFQNIIALFKVLFISVLIAHLFACSWYFIGDNSNSQNNWLKDNGVLDESWDIKYLFSMYWACITMMTVGYGDITPTNNLEIVFCLITVVLGCAVYAYNINSIGMILQDLNKENAEFNHKINIINQFMKRKNIKKELQMRIREYLRFIWKEENAQNLEDEQNIIGLLSSSLKEELLIEAYGEILKKFPMFFANFTEKSLKKVVDIIKDIKFFPEEKIFQEKDEDKLSIYFIMKGKVQLITESGIVVKELGVGEHFGEISFFSGKPRILAAKTKDFTTIFAINRDDFIRVLKQNPEDFEKFSMIKDQISIYENYYPLKIRCFSCNQMGHLATNCHLLHFLPDKEKVIKKYNFYTDQERANFNRKNIKKKKALNCKKILGIASKRIKDEKKKEYEAINKYANSEFSLNSEEDLELISEDDIRENTSSEYEKKIDSIHNTFGDKFSFDEQSENNNYNHSEIQGNPSENFEKESSNNFEINPSSTRKIQNTVATIAANSNYFPFDNPNNNFNNNNNFTSNTNCNKRSSDATLVELRAQLNGDRNAFEGSLLKIPESLQRMAQKKKSLIELDKKNTKKSKKKLEIETSLAKKLPPSSFNEFSTIELEAENNEEKKNKSKIVGERKEARKKSTYIMQISHNKNNNKNGSSLTNNAINQAPFSMSLFTDEEFDMVTNFKAYFPLNNSKIIFERLNSKAGMLKYNKMIKEKNRNNEAKLAKYTFFLEEMKDKMPNSIKKKKKLSELKRKAIMDSSDSSAKNEKGIWLSKRTIRTKRKIRTLTKALLKGENKFSDLVKLVMNNQFLKRRIKSYKE